MRKFVMIGVMALAAAVFVLSGPFQAHAADKTIVMKLANANPAGGIKDLVSLKMAELVKARTNGKVVIEVYSGGQLGDWREAIEGLRLGTNEIVIEGVATVEPYSPLAAIDAAPYLFRDNAHFQKVWFGPLGEKMLGAIGDASGCTLLGPMNRGARVVTSKVPFKNMAELKGLKIRVPSVRLYLEAWQALGAAPTPLPLTEVFTALQQNTVVAQENPTIESYAYGFYDVCKYLIETDHLFSADVFIFDRKYFKALPADVQKVLTEACVEAAQWRNTEMAKQEIEFKKMFEAKGVTIITPDRAEFAAACAGITERLYPALAGWVAEIKATK